MRPGTAVIRYRGQDGREADWAVRCDADADNEGTMRAHAARFRPQVEVLGVQIITDGPRSPFGGGIVRDAAYWEGECGCRERER
jgi:hypothetical protein